MATGLSVTPETAEGMTGIVSDTTGIVSDTTGVITDTTGILTNTSGIFWTRQVFFGHVRYFLDTSGIFCIHQV